MGKVHWWTVVTGIGGAVIMAMTVISTVWIVVAQPKIKEVAIMAVRDETPRIDSSLSILRERLNKNDIDHEKISGNVTTVMADIEDLKKMQLITMTPEQRKEYSRYLMSRRP